MNNPTPFDFVKAINTKSNMEKLFDLDFIKHYNSFIINKAFSYFYDTIFHSNEMNMRYNIDNKWKYDYYMLSIKNKNRYSPWLKEIKENNLEIIKKYYSCNNKIAKEYISILSDSEIERIKKCLFEGGIKEKSKKNK